ncbi:hypothetical protein J2847_001721 [Azospirillum agricola]|nr:hypothetical protein [Azospirillum agricola]
MRMPLGPAFRSAESGPADGAEAADAGRRPFLPPGDRPGHGTEKGVAGERGGPMTIRWQSNRNRAAWMAGTGRIRLCAEGCDTPCGSVADGQVIAVQQETV